MRSFRIIAFVSVAAALVAAAARAATPPDAVPDAAAPFAVVFDAPRAMTVREVTVTGLRRGVRVALTCRDCLGQTQVESVAAGARQVFRPNLRLSAASRLEVAVRGRNFDRTRVYRVRSAGLRLHDERCASLADHRRVRCASVTAPRPWATMNVCAATRVGVRAASPGGGRTGDTVFARFGLQYRAAGGPWRDVPAGRSPWVALGSAKRAYQGGYTFAFRDARGREFRGVAAFEWRRDGAVVRRATRLTSPGRPVASGYSSAVCAP